MTQDDPNCPPEQQPGAKTTAPCAYPCPTDEIDLVQLGASLWRRWKLMAVVFFICVGLALLVALLLPKKYQYMTTVQVGTQIVGSHSEPVESPDAAASKVKQGYLPQIIQRYAGNHQLNPKKLKFEVNNPQKTNLVVISGKAPTWLGSAYETIEKAAARELVESELPITQTMKAKLNSQLAGHKAHLQELTDPKYTTLLQQQIASLQTFQKQARKQQLESSRRSGNATDAMSVLLLSNQVQQSENRLADLQQQLQIKLPNKIEAAKAKVSSLETQIDNLQASKVVAGPLRSVEPAGLSGLATMVIGVIVGLIVALLSAILANFLSSVRETIRGNK